MATCESHWVACLRSICRRVHFSRSLPQRHSAHNLPSSDESKETTGTSHARAVSAQLATRNALLVTEAFVSPLPKNASIPAEDLACEENATRQVPQYCNDLDGLAPDATFTGTRTFTRGHHLAFHLQLDRVLVRVGARVPWGRLHRGRFAKVRLDIAAAEESVDCIAKFRQPESGRISPLTARDIDKEPDERPYLWCVSHMWSGVMYSKMSSIG